MNCIIRICLLLSCLLGMGAAVAQNEVVMTHTEHVVKGGESLSKIAAKLPIVTWQDIAKANQQLIKNPDHIEVGWTILIPKARALGAAVPAAPKPEVATETRVSASGSIACAKQLDRVDPEVKIANAGDCERIRIARLAYNRAEAAKKAAQAAARARARATQVASRTSASGMSSIEAASPPDVVLEVTPEEYTTLVGELEEIAGPPYDVSRLAWLILLRRHGILPIAVTPKEEFDFGQLLSRQLSLVFVLKQE